MSKSEKRNFKIFASRHVIGDKSNYVALFDAIDKQTEYNEPKILRKFKNEKLSTNISSVKVQLSKLILRSLRQNNLTNKANYDVRMYLDYLDILFEKGLYDQCWKMAKKARKIAEAYDFHINLDEIALYEYRIAMQEGNYEQLRVFSKETYFQAKESREMNHRLAGFDLILSELRARVIIRNRTGAKASKPELDAIMSSDVVQNDPAELSLEGQAEYNIAWGYYYNLLNNPQMSAQHRGRVLDVFESQEHVVMDRPSLWLYNARLYLISLGNARLFDKFDEAEKRVTSFVSKIADAKKTQHIKAEIYTTIYNVKLDNYIDRGCFEEALEHAKDVEDHLEEFISQIDKNAEMVIYFNMFYVNFGAQNFKTALKWLNRLLDLNAGVVREDIQCFSRIVNILLHFELGNYELIESLVRSTDRFLVKRERKFKVEAAFLRFAKRRMMEEFTRESRGYIEDFEAELVEITKDPFEMQTMEYFELLCWVKSKITDKSFGEHINDRLPVINIHSGTM